MTTMVAVQDIPHRTVLVLRPCACAHCAPGPIALPATGYIPPYGKFWYCLDSNASIVASYGVADLDGYVESELPEDVLPPVNPYWQGQHTCLGGLSEPMVRWIQEKHPGLDLLSCGETYFPGGEA